MTRPAHGWQALTVGTLNLGNARVSEVVKIARQCDVLCLQEAGDRADVKQALRREGFTVLDGDGKAGQSSTPLAFDPATMRLVRPINILLLSRRWIGRGAGPSRNKPKHLVGGRLVHKPTGRRIVALSTHLPPTQGQPLRRRAAQQMSRKIATTLGKRKAIVLVGMDANAVPGKPGIRPLAAAGWTWTQAQQPLGTHGKRGIDGIWWRKRDHSRLRFARAEAIRSHSDHRAVVAVFRVKER